MKYEYEKESITKCHIVFKLKNRTEKKLDEIANMVNRLCLKDGYAYAAFQDYKDGTSQITLTSVDCCNSEGVAEDVVNFLSADPEVIFEA